MVVVVVVGMVDLEGPGGSSCVIGVGRSLMWVGGVGESGGLNEVVCCCC